MTGRTGDALENGTYQGLTYLAINEGNNFLPELPEKKVDILYLCFPNNPIGATITKEELKMWVDYALENKSLILFDAAYEAFIQDNDIPHSIYEIQGAKDCAIEFRSFSKNAVFIVIRCAFTLIPKNLKGFSAKNE